MVFHIDILSSTKIIFLRNVCFWQKEKYCLPWNIVPVKSM